MESERERKEEDGGGEEDGVKRVGSSANVAKQHKQ